MPENDNRSTNQSPQTSELERPLVEENDQPAKKADESSEPIVSGERVAKNAIALYFRMFISMAVFIGRLDALQSETINIASQDATLMLMSYAAKQNKDSVNKWLQRSTMLLSQIKSDTQCVWQLAFMYASTGDTSLYCQVKDIVILRIVVLKDPKRAIIVSTLAEFTQLYATVGMP